MVGRQIGAEGPVPGAAGGRGQAQGRATLSCGGTAAPRRCGGCRSTSGPGRSSASPACRATASASSGRPSPACGPRVRGSVQVDGVELAGKKASAAARRRPGLCARGEDARRRHRGFHRGREPHAGRLRQARVRASRVPAPELGPRPGAGARSRCSTCARRASTRPTRNLSGGNIQKLILARELSGQPKVLLIAQPTRGIDVAAARYIHERLRQEAAKGIAVVIISEDLDEVIAISHRTLVMYEGAIIGEVDPRTHEPRGDRAHDGRRGGSSRARVTGPGAGRPPAPRRPRPPPMSSPRAPRARGPQGAEPLAAGAP